MIESHDVVAVEMESRMVGKLKEGEDGQMIEAHEEVKVESENRMAGMLGEGEVVQTLESKIYSLETGKWDTS